MWQEIIHSVIVTRHGQHGAQDRNKNLHNYMSDKLWK